MTAIEFENVGNILEGFRLAISSEGQGTESSPLFCISSMLLGKNVKVLPSYGIRWSSFLAEMESFAMQDSIPIVEFPAESNAADLAGDTIGLVEKLIIRQASVPRNVATGIKYMVDECADNILEHSQSKYGYISSRIDRNNKIVEICIADKGISVLGSYLANKDSDIKTDLEALQAANRGISTKNRPCAENRGYGLMTTRQMIVSGLGGAFAMISGGTVFMQDSKGRRFFDASDSLKIRGTIVVLRFPYINAGFNYIDYVE